jgi:hypothetical protein
VTATEPDPEHWYQREPERLAWELDQFDRHGLVATTSYDDEGHLIVASEVRFRGEPLNVIATYSHGHPEFPPTIASDRYVIGRHQDPFGKNFCLLEDADEDWRPWFSAAQLVGKSLRNLLRDVETGEGAVAAGEADMPEPVSAQFLYHPDVVILVPEPFLSDHLAATDGTMSVTRGDRRVAILRELGGVGRADEALVRRFRGGGETAGRWVALDEAPRPEGQWVAVLQALDAAAAQPLERLAQRVARRKGPPGALTLFGLTFFEEGPHRGERRRTWMFAEVEKRRGAAARVTRLLRAQALTPAERSRRIPELVGLADTHIILIGAGSLGAPIALELAKAGVGCLDLFDGDLYDVNNAVRHVLAIEAAGELKAEALAAACGEINPFVDVRGHAVSVGDSRRGNELLVEALETAAVVIDTTGVQAVARFLEPRARATETTLLVTGLTAGSFGADLFVIAPSGPCLDCFLAAEADEADATIVPPPAGERSAVTPIGCSHPAFSGAGFEATELAALVVRRAVQATGASDYPASDANWLVLDFRGGEHFRSGRLEVRCDCKGRH